MTFGQFISILRARKWIGLLILIVVVGSTFVLTKLMPSQYTATASVVVDIKPDPVSLMTNPVMALPGFVATQVDIITSDRVSLNVVKELRLAENPQIRSQWEDDGRRGSVEQWLAERLQKNLEVRPSRESNVIQVGYKAPDPRFAASLANAFAKAYIDTSLELRVDPAKQFASFFSIQSKDARETLERAQARLSSFQREKGIIANDERLDVETARLSELSSQLVQIQAIAAESASRQTQAQGAVGDRMQEVLNNPVVGALKADLARAEARFQELTSRLGDRNPQVIEARANIAETRNRIDAETRKVTGGVAVTNTINRQRAADIKAELDAQRAKLLRLKAVRDEGQVLVRDVESAQRSYDNLLLRLNQTAMESQATQSYVNILSPAQPPSEPSSPKIVLNTILALILGTFLALSVVLILELANRKIRVAEDVVVSLGLPVLGTLPKPNAKRFTAGRAVMLAPHRSLSLPALTKSL